MALGDPGMHLREDIFVLQYLAPHILPGYPVGPFRTSSCKYAMLKELTANFISKPSQRDGEPPTSGYVRFIAILLGTSTLDWDRQ